MSKVHYHAGHNMPGYLPESDVWRFETFEAAKQSQIDEMDRSGDCFFDGGEVDKADELSADMEDLNLDNGPEWGTISGGLSWWIVQCSDDCPEDDEVA